MLCNNPHQAEVSHHPHLLLELLSLLDRSLTDELPLSPIDGLLLQNPLLQSLQLQQLHVPLRESALLGCLEGGQLLLIFSLQGPQRRVAEVFSDASCLFTAIMQLCRLSACQLLPSVLQTRREWPVITLADCRQ